MSAPDGPLGPVVVGYDEHASSRRALAYGLALATRLGNALRILQAVDLEDLPADFDAAAWDNQMRARERTLEENLAGVVHLPADRWSYHIVRGDPWHALLSEAEQVDAWMIVVGQHTHAHAVASAVGRMLGAGRTGSVAGELIRRGHRPVLVVPQPEGE